VKYKKLLIAPLTILALTVSIPAFADVNLSIRVGEPTFFGRIDVAGAPPPLLIRPRPIIIEPPSVNVAVEPLYLRVRPEESRNWRRYCHRYDACGRHVYFVKDRWYHDVYVPHYHSHYEEFERREHERMEQERAEHERWQEHHERERAREREYDHDRHDHHDRGNHHEDRDRRRDDDRSNDRDDRDHDRDRDHH